MDFELILATLRKRYGYGGDGSLESVKTFCKTYNANGVAGLELTNANDEPIDLDACWAAGQKARAAKARCKIEGDLTLMDPGAEGEGEGDKSAARREPVNRAGAADVKSYADALNGDGFRAGRDRDRWEKTRYNRLSGKVHGQYVFSECDEAEAFGAISRLAIMDGRGYPQKARDMEIASHYGYKAQVTNIGTLGGFTVPEDFNRTFIDIRTNYGVLAPYLRYERQAQDTQVHTRQTGDLTVYQVGQTTAPTRSDITVDRVTVTTTKLGTSTVIANELVNDSALNFGDRVAFNINWSFQKRLEECIIQGDGTSAYYGFTGFCGNDTTPGGAFRRVVEGGGGTWTTDGNKTNASAVILASGNTLAEVDEDDLDRMVAATVNSNSTGVFFCSRPVYAQVFQRMTRGSMIPISPSTNAALRGSIAEVTGRMVPGWNGYPIVMVESMQKGDVNSGVPILFGELSRSSIVGEVGGLVIKSSADRLIEEDALLVVGFYRAGLTVHDVGNYSATASLRKPAPTVGLALANS